MESSSENIIPDNRMLAVPDLLGHLKTISLSGIGLLSSYWDISVQVAGMEAMESIARHCVSDSDIVKMLHMQYEKLISEGAHEVKERLLTICGSRTFSFINTHSILQVQLAGIRGLTASVAGPGFVHMEFLLKQILLILARVHQKSTAGKSYLQLQEMALTIFHALRTMDGCEVRKTLQICIVRGK